MSLPSPRSMCASPPEPGYGAADRGQVRDPAVGLREVHVAVLDHHVRLGGAGSARCAADPSRRARPRCPLAWPYTVLSPIAAGRWCSAGDVAGAGDRIVQLRHVAVIEEHDVVAGAEVDLARRACTADRSSASRSRQGSWATVSAGRSGAMICASGWVRSMLNPSLTWMMSLPSAGVDLIATGAAGDLVTAAAAVDEGVAAAAVHDHRVGILRGVEHALAAGGEGELPRERDDAREGGALLDRRDVGVDRVAWWRCSSCRSARWRRTAAAVRSGRRRPWR